ncbi:COP9-signalosome 5B [Hibiscus syriacus]|uniref:COP9-signalosome 5B n=1 Tax=Hibiscus syriacus TaxID=106335 RepID=A0A6A3D7K9_HIBSY|nr:COP9-signalosome 5B [Hibiscus syriacus]
MATISGASPRRDAQSGAMPPETPYDRPGFLNSALYNPNWISRNIFPPTRAIVTGAARVLTSVLGFESSSSSSSECGSCPDDSLDNNDDQEVSSQGVHASEVHVHIPDTIDDNNYLRGRFSCFFGGHQREPQSFAGKNKAKHIVEQLLMQESFSRQECDKLTDIIKSRVVDSPAICGLGIGRLDETPERTDAENHDFCNKAVFEAATKLLEEEKSGLNYKSEVPHGTCALNSVVLKHQDVEGEVGSPMDMARSYMQTHPPWASPSKNNTDFRSPSSVAMPLFKEETPYSIGANFLYSCKRKRNSLATGSWNIQDEIRKVRYKATEEMLGNLPSSTIAWSSFPSEHKKVLDSIVANNLEPAKEDKSHSSNRPVEASICLAAKPASQITKDVFHIGALPRSTPLDCEQKLIDGLSPGIVHLAQLVDTSDVDDPDANRLKESNGPIQPFSCTNEGTVQDSQVEDKNHWTLKKVAGIGSPSRFPSGSNMSSEADKEQNPRPIISKEDEAVARGDDNASGVAAEEKRKLLCEASTEVPTANETDAPASGSQHSWNMQHEGSPDQNTPTSKGSLAGKSDYSTEKQQQQQRQGDKVSRYSMRDRERRR